MRLKTDEWMKAHALFTPDPEAAKNPGWFEYFEHYDKPNNQFVPCSGDDCYMCELGDSPSVRALTLWYFPDNPEKEKLKVLKLNGYMIRDFTEIEAEEGGVLGRKFRIKRLSDDGKYRVSPQVDKPLRKTEINTLLKEVPEAMDFETLTLKQLNSALKKQEAVDSLTDEDEDDVEDEDENGEEEAPKSRRGKARAEAEEADEDEDEDEEDEEDEEEEEDEDEADEDEEEEEDEPDEDEEDEEEEADEEEEEAVLTGQKFTVVSTKEDEETVTVKLDGKNTKLWIGQGLEADWDKIKKGTEITVDAATDDEGDWVLTSLKVARPKRTPAKAGATSRTRKTASRSRS
jgi:hypothetical protein